MTSQARQIQTLLRKQESHVRKAFVLAISRAKNDIDMSELKRLLDLGDIEGAARLFSVDRGVLYVLEDAVRNAFIAAGASVVDELPRGIKGVFGFNGSHPRAVSLASNQAARMVTNISEAAVESARALIVSSLEQNQSTSRLARNLAGRKVGRTRVGGVVGLTQPQTERLSNIRGMLSDPDRIPEYFKGSRPRYKESDRRLDGLVRRAIKDGRALSAADVDRVSQAYASKALGNRAKVVAENETFTAIANGRDEAYTQLNDSDRVDYVEVGWQHNLTKNARPDHKDMDGKKVRLGELFEFPDGTKMRRPHDPAGGVAHSANCHCTAFYRVKLPRD